MISEDEVQFNSPTEDVQPSQATEIESDGQATPKKKKRKGWIFYVIVVLVLLLIFSFRIYVKKVYMGVEVEGNSMFTTLEDGDELLMKYSKYEKAERGDIIVVDVREYPEFKGGNTKYLIKRLIAVEGDSLYCEDGQIYICYSGEQAYQPLDEPYARYVDDKGKENKNVYDFGVYTVGEGEIFFLGDNRNHSCDSRYGIEGGSHLKDKLYKEDDIYGVVPTWAIKHQKIIGKIFF